MNDYNFFDTYRKKGMQINLKSPAFLGILVIFMIIGVSAGLVVQNKLLEKELSEITAELETIRLSDAFQETDRLQRNINAMTEYDNYAGEALKRVEQGNILNTEFLNRISGAIPSGVFLENVNITRASAFLIFRTPDRKAAAELLDNLDKSGLFIHTELTAVTSERDKPGYQTEIAAIVKAGEEG